VERVVEMGEALVNHLRVMTENREPQERELASNFTLEQILQNIHYFRVHHYVEQIALTNILGRFLEAHPNVRLIIVDSVTFHFRREFEDMSLRTRVLNSMAQNLMAVAEQFNLAVVLMNQVTTKIGDHETSLVPALGESWGHTCTNRIILYHKQGVRHAYLYKSPSKKQDSVPFQVTSEGIRSVTYAPLPRGESQISPSQYTQSQYTQSQYSQSQLSQDGMASQSQTN